jgi:glycyl-tRNA synthetase beta chain
MSADFLVEIGTEELPPKALLSLAEAFREHIVGSLDKLELSHGEAVLYAAPRRLAVVIPGLAESTPSREVVAWGPPVKIAFDNDGNATKAAEAFARKNNLPPDSLKDLVESDGTQDKLCYRSTSEGVATRSVLAGIINDALAALPIPKRMRWGAKRDEFVRPVHWVVLLLGDTVIDDQVLSITPGRDSRGHRFHSQGKVPIQSAASYAEDLRAAYVIADFDERRALIRTGVERIAADVGGTAVIDAGLLDEVTALNEWPVPLIGSFENRFLEVPAEALISSMKEHQKYFHVVDDQGQLLPNFITVANIESADPAAVVAGNEKVIRPRLSDAAFFYATDRKKTLSERRAQLKSIVFQEKLGTVYDKTSRIARLSAYLAPYLNSDVEEVSRAGELCKSDLVSEMVLEFDDLQGIMGRYYAANDGETAQIAAAMYEHYLPRFAGDVLPDTVTGTTIALADRLDTLVGIFGIGQPPTGSRDPFALRRASLGVLRILVEKSIDLPLRDALRFAASLHPGLTVTADLDEQVLTYLVDRFRAWYEDDGISAEVFMSVQAKALDNPLDFHLRIQAVDQFTRLPEASALAAANKRVSNILAKSDDSLPGEVSAALFERPEEQALLDAVDRLSREVTPLFDDRDYARGLQLLAELKGPVDNFFDQVMVMADDAAVRMNRLELLSRLRQLFLNVADISLLVPAK